MCMWNALGLFVLAAVSSLTRPHPTDHVFTPSFVQGQVPGTATEDQLKSLFEAYGTVTDITILKDRYCAAAIRGFLGANGRGDSVG